MARVSLIETHNLAQICAELYFDRGQNILETTDSLNKYLAEVRGSDLTLSKSAVGSWIQKEREERASRTNQAIRDWAADTVQSDLDTLEMLKSWHLKVFHESKDYKEKRIAAKDCVDVITTKLRIAQAADSGDKTEIWQIMKNEVNAIVSRNPIQDLLEDVADITRGLPNMTQPKLDHEVIPEVPA